MSSIRIRHPLQPAVVAACAAALLLGACAAGPDYVRPAVTVPEGFREAGNWKPAQPRDQEHHELVLSLGRTPDQISTVSQVSFHAPTLQDVRDFHARAKAAGATIRSTVSHGNAIGCYFLDPEGNPVEVYYATGIDWPQPCSLQRYR